MDMDRVVARAKRTKEWLDDSARKLTGNDWLPLSVRTHFAQDVPDLIAEVARLTAELAKAQRVVDAAREWRTLVAGSVLGGHERPLALAVDAHDQKTPATTLNPSVAAEQPPVGQTDVDGVEAQGGARGGAVDLMANLKASIERAKAARDAD